MTEIVVKTEDPLDEPARRSAALRALGQLSGQVAHDLNNMLAVTLTSVEIASRIDDVAKIREFLDSTLKMIKLQRDLADNMARSARACEAPVPLDMHAMIGRLVGEIEATRDASIRIDKKLQATRSLVLGDESFLSDALRSLAANARTAMPHGGTLSIATTNAGGAELNARSGHDYIVVAITDSGTGMHEDVRRKAFDLFFSGSGDGLGLGLPQARDAARRAGGFAAIASEPGGGTTVTLGLPLASDEGGV